MTRHYLVIAQTTLDDIPVLMTADLERALAYARSPAVWDAADRIASGVFHRDLASPISVTVTLFVDGVPVKWGAVEAELQPQ